jgi:hypothetical protein
MKADPIEVALAEGRRVITIPEAGTYLGLASTQSYSAARLGRIPGVVQLGARRQAVLIAPFRAWLEGGGAGA